MNETLDAPSRTASRLEIWGLIAILAVQGLAALPSVSAEYQFNRFNRDDTENYVSLGHSLAHGRGYTRSLDADHYIAHKHWPPGFPLLLAACFLTGDSLLAAHLLVVVLSLLNSLLLWALARRFLGPGWALTAVFLTAFSPIQAEFASVLMAEQPTTTFLLLSALGLQRWADHGYRRDRWALLSLFAVGYGVLVKGLVLAVVPAFALFALVDRRSLTAGQRALRTALLLSVALLPWLAWTLRAQRIEAPGYDGFTELETLLRGEEITNPRLAPPAFAEFTLSNLRLYFPLRLIDTFGGAHWFLQVHAGVEAPAWIKAIFLGWFALGCLWAAVRFGCWGLILSTVLVGSALLLMRPYGGAARYWSSLQPLILLLFLATLQAALGLHSGLAARLARPLAVGGAALAVAAACMLGYDRWQRPAQGGAVWEAFESMCRTARDKTPPDALVFSHNETAARFISRRWAIPTDADLLALEGKGPVGRPVYQIRPLPPALAEHQRAITRPVWGDLPQPRDLPGKPLAVAHNAYYVLERMEPTSAP